MTRAPHHLRFARALALVSGLGGCASAAAPPPPAPAPPPLTAGAATAAPCARCVCDGASVNPPSCFALGRGGECCYDDSLVVEGPLPPPDLPA